MSYNQLLDLPTRKLTNGSHSPPCDIHVLGMDWYISLPVCNVAGYISELCDSKCSANASMPHLAGRPGELVYATSTWLAMAVPRSCCTACVAPSVRRNLTA